MPSKKTGERAKRSPKKQSATEWYIEQVKGEAERVRVELARINKNSGPRYHIEHGAEIMALSMGVNRIANVPADQLMLKALGRYKAECGKYVEGKWPLNRLRRLQLFSYGRNIVTQQLERIKAQRERKAGKGGHK
jgi:hypothetical protein